MAPDLANLGEVITDRTFVLNVLCSLNERYRDIGIHLRRAHRFPSFTSVRNELLLEEINMAHQPVAPLIALIAAGSSAHQPAAPRGRGSHPPAPKQKKRKSKPKPGNNNFPPGGSNNPASSSLPGSTFGPASSSPGSTSGLEGNGPPTSRGPSAFRCGPAS